MGYWLFISSLFSFNDFLYDLFIDFSDAIRQRIVTRSKSTRVTLEKGAKYVQS